MATLSRCTRLMRISRPTIRAPLRQVRSVARLTQAHRMTPVRSFRRSAWLQDKEDIKKEDTESTEQSSEGDSASSEEIDWESKVADLEQKLSKAEETERDLKDRLVRTLAEMENVRTRAHKDMEANKKFGIQSFAKDLLVVDDTFGLALKAATESKDFDSFFEGVEMTRKCFAVEMEKHGLKKFDSIGDKFDPDVHEAVFQIPGEHSEYDADYVGQVLKEGWMLHDRVLRPAQVGIVLPKENN